VHSEKKGTTSVSSN